MTYYVAQRFFSNVNSTKVEMNQTSQRKYPKFRNPLTHPFLACLQSAGQLDAMNHIFSPNLYSRKVPPRSYRAE